MHDVVVVGLPILVIIAGILFNHNDVKDLRMEFRAEMNGFHGEMNGLRSEMNDLRSEMNGLRSEMNGLRTEMNARFVRVEDHLSRIDADLRQFYHLTGKLEARMDSYDKR